MKAARLLSRRVVVAVDAFVEVVVWQVPEPVPPSTHGFKYRLAYVVGGQCVLGYDNERGKGDHRHTETSEEPYEFSVPDQLMADFEADVARWNDEHGRS
jgi:Family of unknown function (DUF6516)